MHGLFDFFQYMLDELFGFGARYKHVCRNRKSAPIKIFHAQNVGGGKSCCFFLQSLTQGFELDWGERPVGLQKQVDAAQVQEMRKNQLRFEPGRGHQFLCEKGLTFAQNFDEGI